MQNVNNQKGFTLIEVLVVIAIIAILAAIVLVAINPAKRFKDARQSQRKANVESIMSAVHQAMLDNKGIWPSACPALTATAEEIEDDNATGIDLAECLSAYLAILPVDPSASGAAWQNDDDYNTKYTIKQDATTLQVTIAAPGAEGEAISVIR